LETGFTKCAIIIRPSEGSPGYLSQRNGNLYLHKNLHTNVYISFIFSRQNLETAQISFNKWVVKNKKAVISIPWNVTI
jgi:hypothetical protein